MCQLLSLNTVLCTKQILSFREFDAPLRSIKYLLGEEVIGESNQAGKRLTRQVEVRILKGSFVESSRREEMCAVWPESWLAFLQEGIGVVGVGKRRPSEQLSGPFLLSRGRRKTERNPSCSYSCREPNGQAGTFVRGGIERKSLKAKTAQWLF